MSTTARPATTVLIAALWAVLAVLVVFGHLPAHALTHDIVHTVGHLPLPVRDALLTRDGAHWLARHAR